MLSSLAVSVRMLCRRSASLLSWLVFMIVSSYFGAAPFGPRSWVRALDGTKGDTF